jgi:hypothetical protein
MGEQKTAIEVIEGEVLPHLPTGELTRTALRRADVVSAFSAAFQMIGGIPRLALWADNNPTEFYKLYARMLPSAASDEMNALGEFKVIHSLPPPAYDPHREK